MREAAYVGSADSGDLAVRSNTGIERLRNCVMCPHRCRVDRTAGQLGFCRTGRRAVIASAGPHFGEERPLVGRGGSGTIFFSGCNLSCVYCQNYDISGLRHGHEVDAEDLAEIMLELQGQGCENVNFVSPSHVVPQILEALVVAADRGLRLPLVFNTGGYDWVPTLRLLDGVFDMYMPDMKYADAETARRLSEAFDYPARNRESVLEMHRQVGDLEMDESGVAVRGLLVRHLVLPDGLAGTEDVMRFLAERVSRDTYVNVMAQYRPCHRAGEYPEIARRPTGDEVRAAVEFARGAGIHRLD